jgi:hypothetical protein
MDRSERMSGLVSPKATDLASSFAATGDVIHSVNGVHVETMAALRSTLIIWRQTPP